MSRIKEAFAGGKAFIPFLTCGDPDLETTEAIVHAMAQAGADLIELGLLEQPHTSAGRVPSQKGYREYVDRLMEVPPVKEEERRVFDSMLLSGSYEPEQLLGRAARLLAGATRCAAVATTPSGDTAQVRAVQFVQTSRRTAMLILMSSAGTMKTRVFHCDFDLTNDILRVFFRVELPGLRCIRPLYRFLFRCWFNPKYRKTVHHCCLLHSSYR